MILPTKHIKLSNSLLNVGAEILKHLDESQTVTSLWNKARVVSHVKTFERFTLGLDLLFMLGIIDFQDGLLRRVKK
jgi:CRISPR/Cas system-associated endonuclease Cas1